MKRLICGVAALVTYLGVVPESMAGPIFVSYTVSGSSGNFDLDFSVTNNMLAWPTQDVYFFGVRLSAMDVTGSPGNFVDRGADWNLFNYGGSNTEYNNTWVDGNTNYNDLLPGQTMSGFIVHDTDLVPPSQVSWMVIAVSKELIPYTGGGNCVTNINPGFEGIANPAANAVPAPSTLVMSSIMLGLFGTGWLRRRLKHWTGDLSEFMARSGSHLR
jgi:hypothetical protein